MKPVVLFRESLADEKEIWACTKWFPVYTQRAQVYKGDLVIPRYSALPFYKELEEDVEYLGGKLINSHAEHLYVADLQNWYYDLEGLTPQTWFKLHEVPKNAGPFVLKGATNSKKHAWNTHMYAENWDKASEVYGKLISDGLVGSQEIYIREYVPLRKLAQGFQGLPIAEEYRFFVYKGVILTGGFYWSEWWDDLPNKEDISPGNVPREFLEKVMIRVDGNISFYVIDVARTEEGNWIVIELNDGQQAGLSMNNADTLYKNLKGQLLKEGIT